METVIESVRAWPWATIGPLLALSTCVYVLGLCAYGGFTEPPRRGWPWLLWPLTLLWWLASYPLRRLGRWWRGRREKANKPEPPMRRYRGTAGEWYCAGCDAYVDSKDVRVSYTAKIRGHGGRPYFSHSFCGGSECEFHATGEKPEAAPEQPGKRAEESWLARDYWKDRRARGVQDPMTPADSKPDIPPYGSKVSEDARPLSRKEFNAEKDENEATHEAMNGRFARIEERVAALESARAGEGAPPFFEQQLDECKVSIGQDGSVVITGWKKQKPANGLVRWHEGKPKDGWYDQDAERRASP